LNLNKSNNIIVNITTANSTSYVKIFEVLENLPQNPHYYDIEIDEVNTEVVVADNDLKITINNFGKTPVTVDSVNINDTSVPLNDFDQIDFNIQPGATLELTIDLTVLNTRLPFTVSQGSKLKILVRTKQGAEDLVDHHTV